MIEPDLAIARGALDPTQFLPLIGAINLIDRMPDGRLRFRIHGERIALSEASDGREAYVDQLRPTGYRDMVIADMHLALDAAGPVGSRIELTGVRGEMIAYRRVTLPLADEHGVAVTVLSFNPDALLPGTQRAVSRLLAAWTREEEGAAARGDREPLSP